MTNTPEEETATSIPNQERSGKRRKVRKGTRSCWECKRRKIKCTFASTEDVTCIGCERRRAPCVGQDLPEYLSPARKGNRNLVERIARVEKLMQDFIASKDVGATGHSTKEARTDRRSNSDAIEPRSRDSVPSPIRAPLTSVECLQRSVPSSPPLILDAQSVSGQTHIERCLDHLLEAFPGEEDAKILLRESSKLSLYIDSINHQPHSKLTYETLSRPYSIAGLPRLDTHPVILAKQMLLFAITLQSPSGEKIIGLSEPPGVLMRCLMTAATTWVTAQEDMHGTVESLICIMLEGTYEVNSGNLRRAWVVYRRAMTVAQLMGLHRSPMPPLKRIDPGLDADPEFMWFRIVYMDRYLSLLLGLPQGTTDRRMGTMSALRHEPPLGKFERCLTIIASRILERNERAFTTIEIATTKSIDAELLGVSKGMPASFWRLPDFQNLTPGSPDTLLETVRLSAQVYYYGLLIQLHLPYMIRISDDTNYEYSKITCVHASREIMTRYIAHRSFNPMSSCSRPVDFFTLLAAMTLLLAHLDNGDHRDVISLLAHQRLSDRALLDQALERMDIISNMKHDIIAERSAELIRQLLQFEADTAEGNSYITRSLTDDHNDDNRERGEELHLHIPHFGVIKIGRGRPITREPSVGHVTARSHRTPGDFTHREPSVTLNNGNAPLAHPSPTTKNSLSNMHGVTPGFAPSGSLAASEPPNEQLYTPGYEQLLLDNSGFSQDVVSQQSPVGHPAFAAGGDAWTLQGVDMAFFDHLMRGTSCLDAGSLEQ
ncbi:hypothetical protein BDV38DRAFT_283944 [Aspergillus pseudotamarii]|uniref:Zn(2)-C6 fungal-type domain-containing protein n=1 Tax=Aspergillus pseudotamarii TaxID=132259 RepID=A0A5N6SP39_ASPPS|nr:uncharacterized protein BDV38DRAFT_283944 [Aspergillus pseudotamarii]KAE8136456.1 hypothetical protein BDV38DRAFT_283944 [Aspergillus pseudotamarii]